jgi:hypothetical protein
MCKHEGGEFSKPLAHLDELCPWQHFVHFDCQFPIGGSSNNGQIPIALMNIFFERNGDRWARF